MQNSTKMNSNLKKKRIHKKLLVFVLFLSMFFLSSFSYSSEECRKELTAHLKELSENSNIYWSLELTGQLGFGTGVDFLSRDSLFGALEYNPGNGFSIYAEGGARYFTLSSDGQNRQGYDGWGYPDNKIRFRLKEGYIKYKNSDFEVSAGLITAGLGDYFLLDERAFGANVQINAGKLTFMGSAGSVVKNFTYGDKGWLKKSLVNWLDPEDFQEAGDRFGDSNFAGASVIFYPGCSTGDESLLANPVNQEKSIQLQGDITSEDEFEIFEEETSFIEKVGVIFNYEFGDQIGNSTLIGTERTYYGAFASLDLGKILHLDTSAVMQDILSNKVLGWYIEGSKSLELGSAGNINLRAGYFGSEKIEGTFGFAPSFTHMAKGEVYGFEPAHAPIIILETDYTSPAKNPWNLSLSYYARTDETSDKASEFNFILQIPFQDGLRTYFIYSLVDSDISEETINYFGVEVRLTI